jgi:CRISPR-associated protein Csb2
MPYRGRLKYLRDCYSRSQASSRIIRPVPSVVTRVLRPKRGSPAPSTLFDGDNVTVLSDGGGFVPSLDAFPLVAKRLRDALLKTAKEMGLPIPTVLSGHDADGSPTNEQHIAILPLADVGWRYSQSRLMGVALVWPRDVEPGQRREALRILASFMREGPSETGLLHFGRRGCWQLTLAPDPDRASLRFERYTRGARCWGTVLPAVLDRHPKDRSGEELAAIVARACINIGLPPQTIDGLNVEASEHAAIKGAPSTTDIRNALSKDSRFRNKPLRHLILTFPRPVRGPLILGAGRFRGLGLCLALDDRVRS